MTQPLVTVPSLDLDRIAQGDPLATRDAIQALASTLNLVAQASAQRIGRWLDVPYDAANFFTNNTGSWTVLAANQIRYKYIVLDQLMILDVALINTTINNGTTTELKIAVPGGYLAAGTQGTRSAAIWNDNSPQAHVGAVFAQGGGRYVSIERWDALAAAGFVNGSTLFCGFVLAFEIASPSFGVA